jgi:hypothetical protein
MGKYRYDAEEGIAAGVSIAFALTAVQGDDGAVRARIQDDPVKGAQGEAEAYGHVRGDDITFVKRYPAIFVLTERGTQTLRQFVRECYGGALLDPEVLGLD